MTSYTDSGAIISPSVLYRYRLWRFWSRTQAPKVALFIMLNPSTADGKDDDATIRRCVGFARDWGMDGIEVVNLFAYRSRDPRLLARVRDPVGPDNDRVILEAAEKAEMIICAWGAHGGLNGRDELVKELLSEYVLHTLHLTRHGHPGHPLYLPSDSRLKRFK